MGKDKQKPEERREKLRQEEWKSNSDGNLNDSLDRASNGSLVDLVGGLGWKGAGLLIIVLIIGLIVVLMFL